MVGSEMQIGRHGGYFLNHIVEPGMVHWTKLDLYHSKPKFAENLSCT